MKDGSVLHLNYAGKLSFQVDSTYGVLIYTAAHSEGKLTGTLSNEGGSFSMPFPGVGALLAEGVTRRVPPSPVGREAGAMPANRET